MKKFIISFILLSTPVATFAITGTGTINYISKWTTSTNVGNSLLYDNGSAVGIGTTAPIGKMNVVGDFVLGTKAGTDGSHNDLEFSPDGGGAGAQIDYYNGGLYFADLDAKSNHLAIMDSGKVGIGTATPVSTLNVVGDLVLGTTAGTDGTHNDLEFSPDNGGKGMQLDYYQDGLYFAPLDASSTHLALKDSGSVGIGVVNPTQKLDVAGYVKGTGLCINSDCRTIWPSSSSGNISGSGTASYLTKWTGTGSIGNSIIYDSGSQIGIGVLPDKDGKLYAKLAVAQTNNAWAVKATSSSSTNDEGAVYAGATATSGNTYGVWGETESTGTDSGSSVGVRGDANSTKPVGGATFGVLGYTHRTLGNVPDPDGTGPQQGVSVSAGVYGAAIGGASGMADGVQGETNSAQNGTAGVYGVSSGSSGTTYGVYGYAKSSSGYAVYANGKLGYKNLVAGIVPTQQGLREFYSTISPEVWSEDFGEVNLVHGYAKVQLDPVWLDTVTIDLNHPMHVFVQPYDNDIMDDVIVRKRGSSFEIIEKHHGISNATLSYRVVAKRRGYEDLRTPAVNPILLEVR